MTTLDQLPVFENIDEQPRRIDRGLWGVVYLLDARSYQLGKVFDNPFFGLDSSRAMIELGWEAMINRELYEQGISVPRPTGIFAISLPQFYPNHAQLPAFIREYVQGRMYASLTIHSEMKKAEELHQKEINRARDCGYGIPKDHMVPECNCLFCLEEDKVILFDFGNWTKAGEDKRALSPAEISQFWGRIFSGEEERR